MKSWFAAAVLLLMVLIPARLVYAGTDEGWAAYDAKDYVTAMHELLPAATSGDMKAQTAIGSLFEEGLGVAQDYTQAMVWYRKAAAQGDPLAQVQIGDFYANGNGVQRDVDLAVQWYRQAEARSVVINDSMSRIMAELRLKDMAQCQKPRCDQK